MVSHLKIDPMTRLMPQKNITGDPEKVRKAEVRRQKKRKRRAAQQAAKRTAETTTVTVTVTTTSKKPVKAQIVVIHPKQEVEDMENNRYWRSYARPRRL